MKEHPLLFKAEMVRAILAGTKTQTRRLVKLRPDKKHPDWPVQPLDILPMKEGPGWVVLMQRNPERGTHIDYPMGKGDYFWVKETYGFGSEPAPFSTPHFVYRADTDPYVEKGFWKNAIFMPRKASRITLEILSIRVERLTDITLEDCFAEGMVDTCDRKSVVHKYHKLWNSINKKKEFQWDANPWVWVIEFKRIKP